MPTFHDFTMKTIDGKEQSLADYRGKALLVVNVASQCGLTPQYAALQALHAEYSPRGFAVLGFPCNQFAGQEPGSDAEVKAFCSTGYGVTFPLFSKIEVNGKGRAPLYAWLTGEPTRPDGPGDIKWNFAKFVVDRTGQVIARFDPRTAPDAPQVTQAVEKAIGG
ncbi:MAG TPA: glutathione peroxidase [Methylomirabilota bacterium]|nr:glutathione peroxidase [Methylomirabilota bacterium]